MLETILSVVIGCALFQLISFVINVTVLRPRIKFMSLEQFEQMIKSKDSDKDDSK